MSPNPTSALQIPAEAMPVVRILRKDVARPNPDKLTYTFDGPRWIDEFSETCPMGLHPKSLNPVPLNSLEFVGSKRCDNEQVESFYCWWDSLPLPEAKQFVDLIWPVGGSDVS